MYQTFKLQQPEEEEYSGKPEHTRPIEQSQQAGPSSILKDCNCLPPATAADGLSAISQQRMSMIDMNRFIYRYRSSHKSNKSFHRHIYHHKHTHIQNTSSNFNTKIRQNGQHINRQFNITNV
ncbi:hypothetical protein PoB_000746600 [Plakobranchus ocellatus]|uniref:Uncharacterized protein n=1 Tax=Plakobranchus ocellatus TaxID=259542 RepID=A0AAV3Y146_9GAST|nr:hypothetical protein PoB_000746600 [Plakobranchus ocellatus]